MNGAGPPLRGVAPLLAPAAALVLAAAALAPFPAAGQEEEEERILRACRQLGQAELEVGIEGTIRDDESRVPLPGATVLIRYEAERGLTTPEDVRVEADERGRYQVCGLEAFREIRVRSTYRARRGKERKVELDRSQFVDLEVDMGDAAFVVLSVIDAADGRPVAGARIDFSPLPVSGVTDTLGRVAFRSMPPLTYGLRVAHIGYAPLETEINILTDQRAEFRVELNTQAIALAPIEVRVTGRDPFLLTSGFYERRQSIDEGYFATHPDIDQFIHLGQVFQFKRELSIRYRRNQLILLNGRPAIQLGYHRGNLSEIPLDRVRGVEAYRCIEAPPEILNAVPIRMKMRSCNLVAIWTY
ncbi:MAG: carboxypeptidase regulatory-like domain-containing protein [Gemmatimonadota bacterium]|uniref:carboxypeptidase regulatory-like domain-containing protein n=1 Tax=Candidatus Palauibacter scopulicola TaxID=3056741 RepID=UPI0023892F67|nr:carboxypeptidase regulatory-like domain-containing protein [Candidatus Palauibacter scopulicola]MDE2661935.1 carboxypeptidase regulatory-like domain-containing protein [Candidatus Palauibacter scopulicola]